MGYQVSEPSRTWAAKKDGEILFQVTGPDAEAMVRATGEPVAYRENCRPTAENGWTLWGPWIDVE